MSARFILRVAVALAALGGAVVPRAAEVPEAELRALAQSAEREVRGNILPFWMKHAPNPANGAFYGYVDAKLRPDPSKPRGSLLTARILWTFSAAYRRFGEAAYREMADRAYWDLEKNFRDREHGGYFWLINPDGRPKDPRKQVYGQAFAIYALSEYHRATGNTEAREAAIALYRLVDQHTHDPVNGGYFDVAERDWSGAGKGAKNLLSSSRLNAAKSQNSHLHVLEAFTNLMRIWPDDGLRVRQRELIEVLMDKVVDSRGHLIEFMDAAWRPVGKNGASYGHDIEFTWLLHEAATVLGDPPLLARVQAKALAMAKVTAEEGLDKDGSLCYAGEAKGITNFNKEWWPQAEAAVGFFNAWQLSGDPRWLERSRRTWDFIQAKVVDRVNGDWYSSLDRQGRPQRRPRIATWICPYHSSRSCLELIERVEQVLAKRGAAEAGR